MSLRYTISTTNASGECRVVLQILHARQKREVNTGIHILPQYWDRNTRSIKAPHTNAAHTNRMLQNKLATCQAKYVELLEHSQGISIARLQAELQNIYTGAVRQHMSFIQYGLNHVEQLKLDGRMGHAITVQQHLNQFNDFCAGRHLSFGEVDKILLTKYKRHLTGTGISNTTIGNYLRSLRLVYNAAIESGLAQRNNYPFTAGLIPARAITPRRNITATHVQQLINYLPNAPAERAAAVRVWLTCFMLRGIDFIDLAHLTAKQLRYGYFTYVRQKTALKRPTPVRVLLPPQLATIAAPLISKGTPYYFNLLQQSSNSNMDSHRAYKNKLNNISKLLAKVGDELQFDRPLSMKMNRHTFASIARQCGIDKDTIAAMLGHTNTTITDIYIEHNQTQLDAAHLKVLEYALMPEQVVSGDRLIKLIG